MSGSTPDPQRAPPPVHRTEGAGRSWVAILLVVCVGVSLVAVGLLGRRAPSTAQATASPGASAPTTGGLPTPRSSLVSSFIEQTDGLYGYRMLRPANWTPLGAGSVGRGYGSPAGAGAGPQVSLSVGNLTGQWDPTRGGLVQALLFEQNPTVGGWTAAIEALWARDGEGFTLLRSLPTAKIYAITSLGGKPLPFVEIAAYAIDRSQPLTVEVQAQGTDADLAHLTQQGFMDDLVTMVSSLQAIPLDPGNVDPPLPTPAPPEPYQPSAAPVPSGVPSASFVLPPSLGAFTTPLPPAADTAWGGIRWTHLAAGDPLSQVRSVVRWSGGFLAVGLDQATPNGWWTPLWRSADGASWQPLGQVFGAHTLVLGVTAAGHGLVALTANAGTSACPPNLCGSLTRPVLSWTSSDGLEWSAHTDDDLPLSPQGVPHLTIAGGPAGLVVATAPLSGGVDLTVSAATSADGATWTLLPTHALPADTLLWEVRGTSTGFVGVGRIGPPAGSITGSLALTSRDGQTWSSTPLPVAADSVALVDQLWQGAGGFLATGSDSGLPGTALWWQSDDGRTWKAQQGYAPLGTCVPDVCPDTEPAGDVGADGTRIVAYRGGADPGLWTSLDGRSWSRLTELGTPLSVFQAGGNLVVLPGGVLLTDGTTTWFGQAVTR